MKTLFIVAAVLSVMTLCAEAQPGGSLVHVRLYDLVHRDDLFDRAWREFVTELSTPKERIKTEDRAAGLLAVRLSIPAGDGLEIMVTASITIRDGKIRFEYTKAEVWKGDEEDVRAIGSPVFRRILDALMTKIEGGLGESTTGDW